MGKGLGEEPVFRRDLWLAKWFVLGGKVRAALDRGDVDEAWEGIEACLIAAYGESAAPPRARIALQQAHPKTAPTGDAASVALSICTNRRRRLQALRLMIGKPDRRAVVEQLQFKIREDPDPKWALFGRVEISEQELDCLIEAAKAEEEQAICALRKSRFDSFYQWATVETKGSLKQVCRWMREGPRLPSEYGLFTTEEGEILAGEAGLLEAVDVAWWPLETGCGEKDPAGQVRGVRQW